MKAVGLTTLILSRVVLYDRTSAFNMCEVVHVTPLFPYIVASLFPFGDKMEDKGANPVYSTMKKGTISYGRWRACFLRRFLKEAFQVLAVISSLDKSNRAVHQWHCRVFLIHADLAL